MSASRFETYVRRRVKRQVGKRALLSKYGERADVSWIETHQTLIHHRKTNRAIALLKCNRYKFVGHMVALWLWALDNLPPSGKFGDLIPAEIADAAGWDVKTGERFTQALIAVGFIDEDGDDGMKLHNWEKYTGLLMRRREAGRKGGIASGEARKQTSTVLEPNPNGASTPTSPHLTNQTLPDRTNLAVVSPTRERLKASLTLAPEEWNELIAKHGSSVHARYWEWVDWIGEREGERMPTKTAFVAFRGFLEKKPGVTYVPRGGAGQMLREVAMP